MDVSSQCVDLVTAWEGLPDGDPSTVNFDPYQDPVGIWTIGYGRALRDPATGQYLRGAKDRAAAYAQYPGGISKAQAVAMLNQDLGGEAPRVSGLVRPDATQSQFDALVSFDFNTGGLASSTLRALHMSGAPAGGLPLMTEVQALALAVRTKTIVKPSSIRDGFAVWSFAQKAFLGGLFCRRLAEFALYSGLSAAQANAFGVQVRNAIAH
jgi:lysozyme